MKVFKWVINRGRPLVIKAAAGEPAGVELDDALIVVVADTREEARAMALEYGNEFGRYVEWIDHMEPIVIDLEPGKRRVLAYHGYPAMRRES